MKTEENVKLKIVLKGLKEIVQLRKEIDNMNVEEEGSAESIKDEESLSKMKNSRFRRKSPQSKASPAKSVAKSKQV